MLCLRVYIFLGSTLVEVRGYLRGLQTRDMIELLRHFTSLPWRVDGSLPEGIWCRVSRSDSVPDIELLHINRIVRSFYHADDRFGLQ